MRIQNRKHINSSRRVYFQYDGIKKFNHIRNLL